MQKHQNIFRSDMGLSLCLHSGFYPAGLTIRLLLKVFCMNAHLIRFIRFIRSCVRLRSVSAAIWIDAYDQYSKKK